MTLEGQGPGAEETPAPPARTRWSEESGEEEDVLLPPFVAGRSKPRAGPPATETSGQGPTPPDTVPAEEGSPDDASDDDAADPWSDTADPTGAAADGFGADPAGEDFGAGATAGEDFGAGAAAGTVEPEAAPSVEESPFDYPWDSHPGEGEAEVEAEVEAEAESDEDWSEDEAVYGSRAEAEDEFPLGAFDIEGQDLGISGSLGTLEGFADGESGTPGDGEVAERLDRLAGILRREGRAGVERELASGDRLTMLLAGVLAGYLAGREY